MCSVAEEEANYKYDIQNFHFAFRGFHCRHSLRNIDINYVTDPTRLCSSLVKHAKSLGASFLSLPECFAYMGVPGTGQTFAHSHEIPQSPLFRK